MERKLASVQKVLSVKPIPKADAIELVEVLGWQCIVLKSENFKVGDLVVYIEIDSQVPPKPEFEFLRPRKFRIRTIKLRGKISQGLVLPLSVLGKGKYTEGQDVSVNLGVTKYDPELQKEQKMLDDKLALSNNRLHKFLSKYPWYRKFIMKPRKGGFPKFIKKTDESRIQLFPYLPEQHKNTVFGVSEKLDGQSGTYFLIQNDKKWYEFWKKEFEFGVCSRNIHLAKPDNSSYWTIAKQLNIEHVLHSIIGDEKFVVLQGEIIGEGIQKNKYKIKGYDFYAFNLIYPTKQINNSTASNALNYYDIKFVPILDKEFKLFPTIEENVNYAKGKSVLYDTLREGVVIRNNDLGISYKIINPEFLLKNDKIDDEEDETVQE